MPDAPVAFIDSGVGGLPYLACAKEILPAERFVYVADREHFPYGLLSPEQIAAAVTALTARLVSREGPKLIVVACNTMSVVALAELRRSFSVPFVGVVPAVKPAAEFSRSKRIGVLATQRTVEGRYLKDLIEKFAAGCVVECLPAAGLVDFVEREMCVASTEERRARVRTEAEALRAAHVDTVVLACTHFLHLAAEFAAELGDGVRVIDSREGVTRQIKRVIGVNAAPQKTGRDALYVTGPEPFEDRYRYFARSFGLELEGKL